VFKYKCVVSGSALHRDMALPQVAADGDGLPTSVGGVVEGH